MIPLVAIAFARWGAKGTAVVRVRREICAGAGATGVRTQDVAPRGEQSLPTPREALGYAQLAQWCSWALR